VRSLFYLAVTVACSIELFAIAPSSGPRPTAVVILTRPDSLVLMVSAGGDCALHPRIFFAVKPPLALTAEAR
jgi:hypothetical protein